jgi:pyruvate/2-oxoglutarate dehydrogenase complex dihydrolipoamide acyltransferase (E2) component
VAKVIVMPKLGLTMKEGVLKRWLVELGERVEIDAPLLEVETDKIETETGSPAAGVLLRRIEPEVEVPVGEPIGVIGEPGEDVSGVALFDAGAGP